MGANQSAPAHGVEAGPLRYFGCCDLRDDSDDFVEISKGQLQSTKAARLPFRPVSRSKSEPPVQRSRMTTSTVVDTPPPAVQPKQSIASSAANHASQRQNRADTSIEEALPQNKRLSPMPDFTVLRAEEMAQIAAVEPWVKVRSIAEKTPSRRSSFLDRSRSPRLGAARSRSHTPVRSAAASPTSQPVARGKSSAPEHKAGNAQATSKSTARTPRHTSANERTNRSPPPLRLQTEFDINRNATSALVKSRTISASDTIMSNTTTRYVLQVQPGPSYYRAAVH